MRLEHVVEGDWNTVRRNFESLQQTVPDTGGQSIRLRAGGVTAAGAVHSGSGFSSVRNAAGDFTVTVGFSTVPTVLLSAGETGVAYSVKLHAGTPPSTTGFRVFCFDPATGSAVDGIFYWIAIG